MNSPMLAIPQEPRTRKAPKPAPTPKAKSKPMSQAERMQYAAGALAILASLVLTVSITHLAEGFVRFTHSPSWISWLLAVVFDLCQIGSEVALVIATGKPVYEEVKTYLLGVVFSCTAVSIGMNVAAFTQGAQETWHIMFCAALGVIIPLAVLALFQAASKLALAR